MRSNLDIRPAGDTVRALKPVATAKAAKPREHKLGATARSFAILDHVAASHAPVDVLDIIGSLKLPKATAYRLVDWFLGHGYLAREPGRKRLIVGPRLANLAFGVLSASMRNDAPHLVLQRLVRTLNETCNIGTLLNGEVVYLDRVEAEHWPLRLHYTSGSRVPLHCSAIGKLFLALAPSPRRQRLLQSLELRSYTDGTITDKARLEAELRQIRKEQVSFDREEYLVGVVCMAVPVLGKNGETLAALAIQAPEARMNVSTARGHLPALRGAAAELAKIFQDK
jgi:IclR family acetate operon transcriptional repressor